MKFTAWLKNNLREIILMSVILAIGLYFRLQGISSNHSFWSDEAFSSTIARDVLAGEMSLGEAFNILSYQRMQLVTLLVSFKLFGNIESSARIFSVFWGILGILFSYLLIRKHSNKGGALLGAIIFSVFQLNLAHSTQAKPFVAIETLSIMVLFFHDKSIIVALILAVIASFYNYIGLIAFVPTLFILIDIFSKIKRNPWVLLTFIALLVSFFVLIRIDNVVSKIFYLQYNWTSYLREIFWRQYGFITLPSAMGLLLIKNKKTKFSVLIMIMAIAITWSFVSFNNIRYLMPIFGILIVLFGIFWGIVGEKLFKKPYLICLLVAVIVYAGGNKIARKPSVYYSPNADLYADVQNADFKTFFQKTYEMFPDFDNLPVFVGPFDTLSWYTKKYPSAIFSISTPKPVYVDVVKSWQYGSLEDFKKELAKYPKGLVIVNDWQSYMPEDIKEYVRKNMKLELRVESLSVSPDDKWPLELYSWGMFKKIK